MKCTGVARYTANNVPRDRRRSFMATSISGEAIHTQLSQATLDVHGMLHCRAGCLRPRSGRRDQKDWSCVVNPRFRDGFGGSRLSVVDVELLVVPDCPNESGALSALRLA